MHHPWPHAAIDPQHHAGAFETIEQIVEVSRFGIGFHLRRLRADARFEKVHRRLDGLPVDQPGLARAYPGDGVRRHATGQQPMGHIHASLAAAEDHISAWGRSVTQHSRKAVRCNKLHTIIDQETRRVERRNRCFQIGRVDRLSPDPELRRGPGGQGNECPIAFIFGQRMVGHAATGKEDAAHHLVEIGAHLGPARKFVKSGVVTIGVLGARTQGQ